MTPPPPQVLVIEDEPQMRRFLRALLVSHGFGVIEAPTAREGAALAAERGPAVILLDLGLPDRDGVDLTRSLREGSAVPILVISARGREEHKIDALDAGADDYLTKPFGAGELLARIRVALRHAAAAGSGGSQRVTVGPLVVDLSRREVLVDGREVHLTPIEFRLLALLARNAGKVVTHRSILREVWGPGQDAHAHYVRVHMAELRKKIERVPAQPRLLVTEPGVGYRLRDRVE